VRILVTGGCGFTGFSLLRYFAQATAGSDTRPELFALDNLSRAGSERQRSELKQLGGTFLHGDLRCASDVDALPPVDWVIDAAANPSVLAGVDGQTSSRQLIEHNLLGTINLLEYCARHSAGFILVSSSRVYSINSLAALPLETDGPAFQLAAGHDDPTVSPLGVTEQFSTDPPVSLYGSTKRASEILALEYSTARDFPVWINRCGLLSGPGQFGRPDQGIVAFWIHSWQSRRPLRYIGFSGHGQQVRDCLHPDDLARLLQQQMASPSHTDTRLINVSGSAANSFSLQQLSAWCQSRFGNHPVTAEPENRQFDIPWLLLDHSQATNIWNWQPEISRDTIFTQIATFAEQHPDWLAHTCS
jgi:CDP-paratose 2-epimerase